MRSSIENGTKHVEIIIEMCLFRIINKAARAITNQIVIENVSPSNIRHLFPSVVTYYVHVVTTKHTDDLLYTGSLFIHENKVLYLMEHNRVKYFRLLSLINLFA